MILPIYALKFDGCESVKENFSKILWKCKVSDWLMLDYGDQISKIIQRQRFKNFQKLYSFKLYLFCLNLIVFLTC